MNKAIQLGGSAAFIPTFENAAYGIEWNYNLIRGSNGQDTDKVIRVLLLGGDASNGSVAGSGYFFLIGFGRVLLLVSASLPQLSLIK